MDFSALLTKEERAAFSLRALYASRGFTPYRMSKFEEYDLYAKNKDFLLSSQVITFTDTDGKLMALKPDVTLSIAKNFDDTAPNLRVYYNENVYRPAEEGGFREILQSGVERFGTLGVEEEKEVLDLALSALSCLGDFRVLSVSHLGLLEGLLEEMNLSDGDEEIIFSCVRTKNSFDARALCTARGIDPALTDALVGLILAACPLGACRETLFSYAVNDKMKQALADLSALSSDESSVFDFSVLPNRAFYSGVVFAGYVQGVPTQVLAGGRYDKLMTRLGKKGGAIGFAVYLDRLAAFGEEKR